MFEELQNQRFLEGGLGENFFSLEKGFPQRGAGAEPLPGVQGETPWWEVWRAKPSNLLVAVEELFNAEKGFLDMFERIGIGYTGKAFAAVAKGRAGNNRHSLGINQLFTEIF